MYAGRFDTAEKFLKRAKKDAEKCDDVYAYGRILITISRNWRKKGDLPTALIAAHDAYHFAEKSTNNVLQNLCHRNFSRIYEALGDPRLALENENRWRQWKTNTGHPYLVETNEKCARFEAQLKSAKKV